MREQKKKKAGRRPGSHLDPVTRALTNSGRVQRPVGPNKDLPIKEADEHHCNARKKKSEGYCEKPPGWGTGLSPYDEVKGKWRRCKLHGGSAPGKATAIRNKKGEVGLFEQGIPIDEMATYESSFDERSLDNEVAVARTQVSSIAKQMKKLGERVNKAVTRISDGWVDSDKKQWQREFKSLAKELGVGVDEARKIWFFFSSMQDSLQESVGSELEVMDSLANKQKQMQKTLLNFLDVVGRLRERDQKLKNDMSLTLGFKDVMELIELLSIAMNDICGNCPHRQTLGERLMKWKPWATKDLKKHVIEEMIIKETEKMENDAKLLTAGAIVQSKLGGLNDDEEEEADFDWEEDDELESVKC